MIHHTIVQSSELSRYNRMDARFFIALRSVEPRYHELKNTVPVEKIRAQLALLTPKEKEPCLVLARGQGGPSSLPAIEKEYPHLAWALIEPALGALIEAQTQELEQLRTRIEQIKQLGGLNHALET